MKNNTFFAFNKENFKWLYIGLAINILGFILMIGGGTDDPTKFDGDKLFSSVRITIAPMVAICGYIVMIYAIFKKTKPENEGSKKHSTEIE